MYIFHLGHQPLISLAELAALFPPEQIKKFNSFCLEVAAEEELNSDFINSLGGTIKISEAEAETNMAKDLIKFAKEKGKEKLRFGLSIFPPHEKYLKKHIKELKTELKEHGVSGSYANQRNQNLTSVQIKHGKLLKKGIDLNLSHFDRTSTLSRTFAIQNFEQYGKRDFEKPGRDMKMGMLTPKLSQIMINIANPSKGVYDPFCGTGTVLMEALLKGFNAHGSDLDKKAVKYTAQNLDWLNTNFKVGKRLKRSVSKSAAEDLDITPFLEEIDTIVSETYLGPPLKRQPLKKEAAKIHKDIEKIYIAFFKNMSAQLPKGFRIVINMPVHETVDGPVDMHDTIPKIEKLGFKLTPLLPSKVAKPLQIKSEKTLVYGRPKQFVRREITLFTKT